VRMPVLSAGLIRRPATRPWAAALAQGVSASYPCGVGQKHCTCAATAMCSQSVDRCCSNTTTGCAFDANCTCGCTTTVD
jgi:hypothetical protein